MSPVSFDAAVQATSGRPCEVSPSRRRVQLHLLQLDGRQLGGAGTSLEEPLQDEKQEEEEGQEGGTETGEEEEEEEKGGGGGVEAVQLCSLFEDVQERHIAKGSPANTRRLRSASGPRGQMEKPHDWTDRRERGRRHQQ